VGLGSFYNHFQSKEELFEAAVEDVLDLLGGLLDELTADIDDPAEVFAQSFRLFGRIHRRNPDMSKVFLNTGWPWPARAGASPPGAARHPGGRSCRAVHLASDKHRYRGDGTDRPGPRRQPSAHVAYAQRMTSSASTSAAARAARHGPVPTTLGRGRRGGIPEILNPPVRVGVHAARPRAAPG
jgi:AcrR family transcriptional regulator